MADEYTSSAITFAGLGSGTDFSAMVDSLVDVEMNRVRRLQTWKASWENKNQQFQALNTQMLSMKTTLEGVNTLNKFMSKAVSTTDSTKLTATADSDAQEASHTIEIGQLATNDVLIASGASALDGKVTTADTSFTFSYAGTSYTIDDISAGTTLEGFVNIINNHPDSRSHIRASTIFDGEVYHLQLTGKGMGEDNQIVISNTGSLTFGAGDFIETQNAVNSQIRVDGFPGSNAGWIERDSNVISDVVEGISLNLREAEAGSYVKLNVVADNEAIKENIVQFVDAINTVRAQIKAITAVDEEGEGSILTGNYGVDMVGQRLKSIAADMGQGFTYWDPDDLTGDKYSALSHIGILTDAEQGSPFYGLLSIDEEVLDAALADDPDSVAALFAANNQGESQSTDFTFTSLIEGTTKPGVYDIVIVSDGTEITSATINGEPAKASAFGITGISGDALGMGIRLDNTAAGTYTGTVSIKMGKTGEMIEELEALTQPYNEYTYEGGPLAVLQDNYNDIMDNIDKKIEYETTRINKLETNLKLKFSRLDALLGQYELRQGQLENSLSQLA